MTGKPLLDKILLALNGLVALGAAGLVFYAHHGIKPVPTDQKSEEAALTQTAAAENQIQAHQFKPMVVNIYSEGTRLRFLEVEMGVLPFKEIDKEVIKDREYLFKNALVHIAGAMSPDELSTVTGKILLETRLKKDINERLGSPLVKKIFFAKFIVQ